MVKINLLKILEGDISILNKVDVEDIALYEDRVTVEPRHVRKMLSDYLAGKISSDYLTRWAKFICLRSEYGTPYYLVEQTLANYFEDMFYVIQRLSTPEIDGEVNEERIKEYLTELEKHPPS